MMRVIVNENNPVGFDPEIKPTFRPSKRVHGSTHLFRCGSTQFGHGHGSHAILDVDPYRDAQGNIVDYPFWRNEVKQDLSIPDPDILRVKVAFRFGITSYLHATFDARSYRSPFF